MRLFIYHLTRSGEVLWDEAAGFIVRARSSKQARRLVASLESYESGPGYEGGDVWTDPRQTRCHKLGEVTPGASRQEGVVARDFKAG